MHTPAPYNTSVDVSTSSLNTLCKCLSRSFVNINQQMSLSTFSVSAGDLAKALQPVSLGLVLLQRASGDAPPGITVPGQFPIDLCQCNGPRFIAHLT